MTLPEILQKRAEYSRMRLEEFQARLLRSPELTAAGEISIFCAGSYARLEASKYSDIDLFFVYGRESQRPPNPRTAEIKLFASLIEIASTMNFPEFSNDSEYLATMECAQILEHMGSRDDDGRNHFTMRMLLLLEGKCIYGGSTFESVQKEIISAYYRDYPDHQSSFEPWFFMNDIGRFWKTLLLNYEHKRNQPTDDEDKKVKQKIKNFKLKYSRMTTCFATIAALASFRQPVTEEDVYGLVQMPPHDRLDSVRDQLPQAASAVNRVLDAYSWFIEQTARTEDELRQLFLDKNARSDCFRRANSYGDAMFDLLNAISASGDANRRLLRYLVI